MVVAFLLFAFQLPSQRDWFSPQAQTLLNRDELLVWATRGEMGGSALFIGTDFRARSEGTFMDPMTRKWAPKIHKGDLTKGEREQLAKLLTRGTFEKLRQYPRANPMWPSAYDGMDSALFARVGKGIEVWRNRDFDWQQDQNPELLRLLEHIQARIAYKK